MKTVGYLPIPDHAKDLLDSCLDDYCIENLHSVYNTVRLLWPDYFVKKEKSS